MKAGGWLFANRGWLPVPLLAAMLSVRAEAWGPGLVVVGLGEAVRLAAVGHIGAQSRTRGDDVGVLVSSGPYGRVRNPLYMGNILIFSGLGVIQWPWVFVAAPLLAVYYSLIVRWEEQNLTRRLGPPYVAYLGRVPRWIPRLGLADSSAWDARRALRSERSTLVALCVVLGLTLARASLP